MRIKLILVSIMSITIGLNIHLSSIEALSQMDKLNQEIKEIQEQLKVEEKKAQNNQMKIDKIQEEKERTNQDIQDLITQMNATGDEVIKYNKKIIDLQEKSQNAAIQLEAVKERLADRKMLMDNRVRAMYTNGFVSYMDVLLNSTSFFDFISRVDSIKMIIEQDKNMIESIRDDELTIIHKRSEMKEQLNEVAELYTKSEKTMKDLQQQEEEKQLLLINLDEDQQKMFDITEDQERVLMKLAKESSEHKNKKKLLEAEKKEREKVKEKKSYNQIKPSINENELMWPLEKKYTITSKFGYRTHPITGEKESLHNGIDIGAPGGTPILAAESGTVLFAQWTNGYGNAVIIDHGNGLWTVYAHIRMNGIKVKEGEDVRKGQKIAEVGSTGNSTGNHLHFEVRINEEAQNPLNFV
ncbi:hypothetical protein BK120_23470 [Paenibacillus sp. FSL A5-0031]|uniref:murein hydrolase activator EnvC family protein n=1 Tax=Paenibacillus sp. FSL A5-0031 TaxID=1920420 RepID=UPI00096F1440|nr:M23 family metallopeptidase [Paenibacillus sp. FSL A5-0031]OME78699.1 hypothetical protein BK120_23470 [Paenibacillus sp. FSL A5-0031]